jgi:TolB protein
MTGVNRSALLTLSFIAASATAGADSPHRLTFASFAPLDTDLFIADADGSNARPLLSNSDLDYDASFSRDGEWVIFTSHRGGSADIYRAHPDGSGLERLIDDPSFDDQGALSPDGRRLAFVSSRGGQADIWILDLAGRTLTNLTHDPAGDFRPAWSPDGHWIAFSSDRDSSHPRLPANDFFPRQTTGVYLVRDDGSDLRALTKDFLYAGSPAWSPDGKQLAFYSATLQEIANITGVRGIRGTTQIEVLDVAGGTHTTATTGVGEKWSPQWLGEKEIGYVSGGAAGGIERTAAGAGARGEFRNASWSADGKRVVFQRDVGHGWPPFHRWHSLDPRFELTRTGIFASFSPMGDRFVSNDKTAGMHQNKVLIINGDGTGQSVLFADPDKSALAPVWSPRGNDIAFALGRFFPDLLGPAQADIVVLPVTGGVPRVLTDGKSNYAFPSWSGDGKEIVYREAWEKRRALHVVNVATGKSRVLIEGTAHYNFPAWSPRKNLIAFLSDHEGDYEIYTIHPDGSRLTRLTHSTGNEGHLSWSQDGEWIGFSSARGGYKDEAVLHPLNPQSYGEIFVMRADGSDQHALTDDQFEEATVGWMP